MNNKEYVLDKIINTEVSLYPWKHMVIDDFLPQLLFQGIKNETSIYLKREEVEDTDRAFANLFNKSVDFKPDKKTNPYLNEYFDILDDVDIERAIKKKVNLEEHHNNELSVDMWSAFDIHCQGFVYGVHPDHGSKMHTLVHYFGDEGDDEDLGTSLYSPDVSHEKLDTTKDYLKRTKYIPNTVLLFSPCFEKGFITNHSMFHLSEKTIYRQTIQTFWLSKKENWLNKLKTAIKLD
jgi:hypothetical protein